LSKKERLYLSIIDLGIIGGILSG